MGTFPPYIHGHISSIHTWAHVLHTYMGTFPPYIHGRMSSVHATQYMHAWMHMQTWMYENMPTCLYAYMHTCTRAYCMPYTHMRHGTMDASHVHIYVCVRSVRTHMHVRTDTTNTYVDMHMGCVHGAVAHMCVGHAVRTCARVHVCI